MPWYDMPLERLREYRTSTREPEGIDDWWGGRIAEARALARPLTRTPHQPGLYDPFEVDDVERAVQELAAKGVEAEPIRVDEFTNKSFTFFRDPDNLPIEIYETCAAERLKG